MPQLVPVLGAGPICLALAGDLGWRGVPCTLIEKTDGRVEHPKMDLIGVRTMEFARRWASPTACATRPIRATIRRTMSGSPRSPATRSILLPATSG